MELEQIDQGITKPSHVKSSPAMVSAYKQESNDEDIVSRIAISAYYKAAARGYEPGHEIQDWLEAESEILQ